MSQRSLPTPLSIGDALFGKTRQAVLGLLFGKAGRRHHVREIVAVTGYGSAQVQRELARLVGCGLVTRTPRGKRVLYKVNRESHACEDVVRLVVGTYNVDARLAASRWTLQAAHSGEPASPGARGLASEVADPSNPFTRCGALIHCPP